MRTVGGVRRATVNTLHGRFTFKSREICSTRPDTSSEKTEAIRVLLVIVKCEFLAEINKVSICQSVCLSIHLSRRMFDHVLSCMPTGVHRIN